MSPSAMPFSDEAVKAAFDAFEPAQRRGLLTLRGIIFETAAARPEIGPLTETLKWGQPAYLPQRTKSGTTVRIGQTKTGGNRIGLFVNCRTSLVQEWRDLFGDRMKFIGTREICLDPNEALPTDVLCHCVDMALTYHLRTGSAK